MLVLIYLLRETEKEILFLEVLLFNNPFLYLSFSLSGFFQKNYHAPFFWKVIYASNSFLYRDS